jgi:hypothetical protein
MILIAGDTHGKYDIRKLNNKNLRNSFDNLPSYLIITGDFGCPWSNDEKDPEDNYLKKWYGNKPYEVIVIPGNHENYNRIQAIPKELYHGAWCHRYSKNIVIIDKNQIMELEENTFFCFGGADSIDKDGRIPFISWWPQEQATYDDFVTMKELIDRVRKVDYVITHTAPAKIIKEMGINDRINDATAKILDYLDDNLKFTHWYFGHMHDDVTLFNKYTCLYNIVKQII